MSDDLERWIVTRDPKQLAKLQAKADELDSFRLADFAMSLGLYPPDYSEAQRNHSIDIVIPPGYEGSPLLVWSAGLDSPAPDDLYEDDDEDDDGEDPWSTLGIGVVKPNESD